MTIRCDIQKIPRVSTGTRCDRCGVSTTPTRFQGVQDVAVHQHPAVMQAPEACTAPAPPRSRPLGSHVAHGPGMCSCPPEHPVDAQRRSLRDGRCQRRGCPPWGCCARSKSRRTYSSRVKQSKPIRRVRAATLVGRAHTRAGGWVAVGVCVIGRPAGESGPACNASRRQCSAALPRWLRTPPPVWSCWYSPRTVLADR